MNFYGFKLKTRNLDTAEKIINAMKAAIHAKAQKLFKELLSQEVQILVDEIVLNIQSNEQINNVYDAAVELLQTKIAVAMAKGINTEYNFSIMLNVFPYNKEIYLQVAAYNTALIDAMKEIKDVEDYSVDEFTDPEIRKRRVTTWEKIIKKYNDQSCMTIKMFPVSNPFDKPTFNDLHFQTPIQRAEVLARHRLSNHYLSDYAGHGEIPPHKLMEYMDQVFLKLDSPESKEVLEQYKTELLRVLPVINEEIVMGKKCDDALNEEDFDKNTLTEESENKD